MTALLVLVLIYTTFGGMVSVVITDYLQFVLLSFGMLLACGLALWYARLVDAVRNGGDRAWRPGRQPAARRGDGVVVSGLHDLHGRSLFRCGLADDSRAGLFGRFDGDSATAVCVLVDRVSDPLSDSAVSGNLCIGVLLSPPDGSRTILQRGRHAGDRRHDAVAGDAGVSQSDPAGGRGRSDRSGHAGGVHVNARQLPALLGERDRV